MRHIAMWCYLLSMIHNSSMNRYAPRSHETICLLSVKIDDRDLIAQSPVRDLARLLEHKIETNSPT